MLPSSSRAPPYAPHLVSNRVQRVVVAGEQGDDLFVTPPTRLVQEVEVGERLAVGQGHDGAVVVVQDVADGGDVAILNGLEQLTSDPLHRHRCKHPPQKYITLVGYKKWFNHVIKYNFSRTETNEHTLTQTDRRTDGRTDGRTD